MVSSDGLGARRAAAEQWQGHGGVAGGSRSRERGARHRHAGRWVVLDARFVRVLSIGVTPYRGIAPKAALDPIARRILLPRIRAASREGHPVADVAEDHSRRWNVRVEPVVGAHSGQLLALLGCYWPAGQAMPPAPPVGGWELCLTPPGPHPSMRGYWSSGLFPVHELAVPHGDGPFGMDGPQWLDELVVESDRAETRLVQDDLAIATTDALHFHTYRIRGPKTGQEHHIRSVLWRDLSEPGPDIWLRGVSIRIAEPETGTDAEHAANRFLEAMLSLSPDPVVAIDSTYEQMFLTTARFAELGVVLPADRRLARILHRDDMPALRAMLADATTHPDAVSDPVRVRFARADGWTTLELRCAGVRRAGRSARHVLCRVCQPCQAPTEHAA